jgi:hypothetical protein
MLTTAIYTLASSTEIAHLTPLELAHAIGHHLPFPSERLVVLATEAASEFSSVLASSGAMVSHQACS